MNCVDFKKFNALVEKVYQSNKPTLLKFLNELEQECLLSVSSNKVKVILDGSFTNASRKRALITPLDYDGKVGHKIKTYQIEYNKRFAKLEHRHILGTLMSLGIERNVIGDVVLADNIYFCCTEEISNFLLDEFKVVNHASINLVEVNEQIEVVLSNQAKDITASSLRIDLVASEVYNLSRSKINEYFDRELVILNNQVVSKSFVQLKNNDVINVRGKGKFQITSISDLTKRNKYKISVIIY